MKNGICLTIGKRLKCLTIGNYLTIGKRLNCLAIGKLTTRHRNDYFALFPRGRNKPKRLLLCNNFRGRNERAHNGAMDAERSVKNGYFCTKRMRFLHIWRLVHGLSEQGNNNEQCPDCGGGF